MLSSVKQLGSGWGAELLGVSSRFKLFAYGTTVVSGGLRVKGHKFKPQIRIIEALNGVGNDNTKLPDSWQALERMFHIKLRDRGSIQMINFIIWQTL